MIAEISSSVSVFEFFDKLSYKVDVTPGEYEVMYVPQ